MKSLASKYCTYRCPSTLKYRNSLAHLREEVYRWGFQRKQLLFNKCQFFLDTTVLCLPRVTLVFLILSLSRREINSWRLSRVWKKLSGVSVRFSSDHNKTKTAVVLLQFVWRVPNSGAVCCWTSKYLLIGIKKNKTNKKGTLRKNNCISSHYIKVLKCQSFKNNY